MAYRSSSFLTHPHQIASYAPLPCTSPSPSLPIILITTNPLLFSPNSSHNPHVAFAPRFWHRHPLIPFEQSYFHKLYTNRMNTQVMASNTRERHPSGEPHPPVSQESLRTGMPSQCKIPPKGEAGDKYLLPRSYTATRFSPVQDFETRRVLECVSAI